jgi:hypothetical protein
MAIMNATIVHGAEIPKLPGDYCSKLASLYNQNDMSEFMKKSCQESEATNRSNVERIWSDIPDQIQQECIKLTMAGMNSYQVLAGCLVLYVSDAYLNGKLKLCRPAK